MGAKNDFLKRLQTSVATDLVMGKAEMNAHTKQAMFDSIMLTLGYGESMGNDKWGEQRIVAFAKEVLETYNTLVHPGLELRNDADGFRGKVDEMLKKKLHKNFESWDERYVFWREEPLEKQAAREKKQRSKKRR